MISDPANDIEVSPATYWEIAIKISLGKYALPESYDVFIEREIQGSDFRILPIEPKHAAALITLPFHHRDPFDGLLIAQAIVEAIPIVSVDAALDGAILSPVAADAGCDPRGYGVPRPHSLLQ
jgi:PIN domain nuclease of toxin-antitoxin system